MGLRFSKKIKLCKGVNLNVGTGGVSISGGVKGARLSVHSSGRKTATFSLPGTGLSYSKTFSGKKKKAKQTAKKPVASSKPDETQTAEAAEAVKQYVEYVDAIRSVHKETAEPMNWNEIYQSAPPFALGSAGPKEAAATEAYQNYKPSLSERLFAFKSKKHRGDLQAQMENAKKEDEEDYNSWKSMRDFAGQVIKGDTDAYLTAIEEAQPFEDLVEYGSDFEFGTEDPTMMEIEFRVKADEVIPTEEYTLSPRKAGLSTKALTKTKYYDYMQDYVCSCAIRLAREIFALLPVQTVLVHAVDGMLNTATGNMEDSTILSVRFQREGFQNINFDRIDPSDFITGFEYNMGFNKTTGFKSINPLV